MPELRVLSVALVVCLTEGCSRGPTPYPVTGQIVFADGTPAKALDGGSVTFESSELEVSSAGQIADGGKFRLNFVRNGDGALAGNYKVAIIPPQVLSDAVTNVNALPIAAEYIGLSTTPLTVTVEKKTNRLTLTVNPPRSKRL